MKKLLLFIFFLMILPLLMSFHLFINPKPQMIIVDGGTLTILPKELNLKSIEKNTYQVSLSSFEIGKYEVTVLDWKNYTEQNGLAMPSKPSWGWNDDYPITNITWIDAVKYCNWLSKTNNLKPAYAKSGNSYVCDFSAEGYRLPTSAEWEFAAKGGNKSKKYKYSGDNDFELVSWNALNSKKSPHQIGTKLPNELGIYDMSGNVWEWCWDWYNPIFYKNEKRNDPSGPERGEKKCIRGGSWDSSKLEYLRSNSQLSWNPTSTNSFFGFRVARKISK